MLPSTSTLLLRNHFNRNSRVAYIIRINKITSHLIWILNLEFCILYFSYWSDPNEKFMWFGFLKIMQIVCKWQESFDWRFLHFQFFNFLVCIYITSQSAQISICVIEFPYRWQIWESRRISRGFNSKRKSNPRNFSRLLFFTRDFSLGFFFMGTEQFRRFGVIVRWLIDKIILTFLFVNIWGFLKYQRNSFTDK